MCALSDLAGSGRSDVLPGLTLMPPTLVEIGEAEEEFGRQHIRLVSESTLQAPPDIRQRDLDRAIQQVEDGDYSFGMDGFRRYAMKVSNYSFLTWLLARRSDPRLSLAEVKKKMAEASNFNYQVLWELWGYRLKKAEDPSQPEVSPSTGGSFTVTSPNGDGTTTKSAT